MSGTKTGLPAVLREWAGEYEEGSFDTEAGLMTEAAEALEAQARLIETLAETLAWVRKNYASGSTVEINDRIDAALAALSKGA